MIIWSSINCPTVICSPTVCYFSREKPLAKPTAPGLLSLLFAFAIYFSLAFIFRSIKPKIQKYLAALYLICDPFIQSITTFSRPLANFWRHYLKGIDNPLNTSGCEWLLFVCRGCLRCVAWFSYWFDNLGFISKGNTYRRCAASSLPLWGNTNVVLADIKRNFWRRCQGDIINIYQVPNHKSHLLAIYIICQFPLVFLSPTSQKFAVLFASLFHSPFAC